MDALDLQRKKGGQNSRKNMTKERASEIARAAARARHSKAKKVKKPYASKDS